MNQSSKPIPSAQVIALTELHSSNEADATSEDKPGLFDDLNPLHRVKTSLQVCVGEVTVTVGELLAATENQVLQLNRRIDQPVDLLLEGKVVARGQLVAVDDCFALRITELPVALKLASKP